jgi:predicted DNA-binding transcriptional regulator AlpA
MTMQDDLTLITVQDVRKMLGVSKIMLQSLIDDDGFPKPAAQTEKRKLFFKKDVEEWIIKAKNKSKGL